MRSHGFRWMGLGSLLAVGVTLALQVSAPAQDNVKAIDIIVKDKKLVFSETKTKIKVGQSIKWTAKDPNNLVHELVATKPKGAFKTPPFKNPASETVLFKEAAEKIDYHCVRHPTMVGSITVEK